MFHRSLIIVKDDTNLDKLKQLLKKWDNNCGFVIQNGNGWLKIMGFNYCVFEATTKNAALMTRYSRYTEIIIEDCIYKDMCEWANAHTVSVDAEIIGIKCDWHRPIKFSFDDTKFCKQ